MTVLSDNYYGYHRVHGLDFMYKKSGNVKVLDKCIRKWYAKRTRDMILLGIQGEKGYMYALSPDYRAVVAMIREHGNMNMYEVLPSTIPVWPFLDIEYYTKDFEGGPAIGIKVLGACMDLISMLMLEKFGEEDGVFDNEDVAICDGSRMIDDGDEEAGALWKCSFHVCIHTPRVFRSSAHLGIFMNYVNLKLKHPDNDRQREIADFLHTSRTTKGGKVVDDWAIDFGVYSNNRLFKLPLQSKRGSTVPQAPITHEDDLEMHLCGVYGEDASGFLERSFDVSGIEAELPSSSSCLFKIKPRELGDVLRDNYYRDVYPVHEVYDFLKSFCVSSREMEHREFAFFYKGHPAPSRYNTFASADDLRARLRSRAPAHIHSGGVYDSMKERNEQTRELVLDIDIGDVEDLRICCSEGMLCERCWGFVRCNIRLLQARIRHIFGCEVVWSFSGGKGFHGWLMDPKLGRYCLPSLRSAYLSFLSFVEDRAGRFALADFLYDSDHGRELYEAVLPDFIQYLDIQQRIFTDQGQREVWLGWIADCEEIPTRGKKRENILKWIREARVTCWEEYSAVVDEVGGDYKSVLKRLIVLGYASPRLDEAVMLQKGHLIKLPFSVHGSSGFIEVPMDVSEEGDAGDLSEHLVKLEDVMQSEGGVCALLDQRIDILKKRKIK